MSFKMMAEDIVHTGMQSYVNYRLCDMMAEDIVHTGITGLQSYENYRLCDDGRGHCTYWNYWIAKLSKL